LEKTLAIELVRKNWPVFKIGDAILSIELLI